MKQTKFQIEFVSGVFAIENGFSKNEAKIKAQAKQINKGSDYRIKSIHEIEEAGLKYDRYGRILD